MKSNRTAGLASPIAAPRVLRADFFARPALTVARDLLGKYLACQVNDEAVHDDAARNSSAGDGVVRAMITETEAYIGPHDLACHGSKPRSARTEALFGPPGCWYVYLIYGMYWMVNTVTDRVNFPSAVLLRGAGAWDGPGKLTKHLAIDKRFNGRPIDPRAELWIEDHGVRIPRTRIARTPRIGVDYAGDWAAKPYRYVIQPPKAVRRNTRAKTEPR